MGKGQGKCKERRGKGKRRRYDGREGTRGWGIGIGGFTPLLLRGIDATANFGHSRSN